MANPTTRLGIPYPLSGDAANVPVDMGEMADAIDLAAAMYAEGLYSARPAAGKAGRFFRATDTGAIYYDTGAAWIAVNGERAYALSGGTSDNAGTVFSTVTSDSLIIPPFSLVLWGFAVTLKSMDGTQVDGKVELVTSAVVLDSWNHSTIADVARTGGGVLLNAGSLTDTLRYQIKSTGPSHTARAAAGAKLYALALPVA